MTTHENVSPRDALDIVFANRNRAYGAYQLRREYPANLGKALGIGFLLIALFLLLPYILDAFNGPEPEESITEVIACPVPISIEKKVPPPVVNTPPAPPKSSIAYKPPVVAPDPLAPEDPSPDVQSVLEDPRNVGSKTVDGNPEGPPALDPPNTGLGVVEAPKPAEEDPVEPFLVNKMPSFPGGEAEMFKWIYRNVRYPDMAKEAGTQGQVVLVFVVGKDGSISDISVVKTPAGGNVLGKEASRVVQLMPKWSPGEANGHPVKVRFTLPIRFSLQ